MTTATAAAGPRLTAADAYTIERFVGYSGGNLAGFSHDRMRDFVCYECGYPDTLWDETSGLTKGPRLRKVIETADPVVQANIVKGLLEMFPADGDYQPPGRAEARPKVQAMLSRLQGVQLSPLRTASGIATNALADASILIAQRGPASGLDRLHTAIHDVLKDACRKANIQIADNIGLEEAFTKLRAGHPKFQTTEPWQNEITSVLRGLAKTLEGLNRVRNDFSRAHPNQPLPDREARLVLDSSHAFLNYLDAVLNA